MVLQVLQVLLAHLWVDFQAFFYWYRNRYWKNLVSEKSLGKIWYRKKVLEPVSKKFGPNKKYRYRYQKYLVPEESVGIGIVKHFGYRHTLSDRLKTG